MGCVPSVPREKSQRLSPKTKKSLLSRGKGRREREGFGGRTPSPVVQDPAPWVEGHKTFVLLEDGQGLFVQADTVLHE